MDISMGFKFPFLLPLTTQYRFCLLTIHRSSRYSASSRTTDKTDRASSQHTLIQSAFRASSDRLKMKLILFNLFPPCHPSPSPYARQTRFLVFALEIWLRHEWFRAEVTGLWTKETDKKVSWDKFAWNINCFYGHIPVFLPVLSCQFVLFSLQSSRRLAEKQATKNEWSTEWECQGESLESSEPATHTGTYFSAPYTQNQIYNHSINVY